jgi:hypothetical protein
VLIKITRGGKYSEPMVPEYILCWQKEKREGRKRGKKEKQNRKKRKDRKRIERKRD